MIREDFHLQRQLLNLNATGHRVQADVRDHSVAVVQLADNEVGTFDNAVVTLKRSIDRVNFFDLEDGITLGQGNSISAEIPVAGVRYLAAEVTNSEGATGEAYCYFYSKPSGSSHHSALQRLDADDHSQYIHTTPTTDTRNIIAASGSIDALTIRGCDIDLARQDILSVQSSTGSDIMRVSQQNLGNKKGIVEVFGPLELKQSVVEATLQGHIHFFEDSSNGNNSLMFQAPASLNTSSEFRLPDAPSATGEILAVNGDNEMYWTAKHPTGTTGTANPVDGEEIYDTNTRTKYIYDASTGYWLSAWEQRLSFGRNAAVSAGEVLRSEFGQVQPTANGSRGFKIRFPYLITRWSGYWVNGLTGDFLLRTAGPATTRDTASVANSTDVHRENVNFAGASGDIPYIELDSITAGSCSNPAFEVSYRRRLYE